MGLQTLRFYGVGSEGIQIFGHWGLRVFESSGLKGIRVWGYYGFKVFGHSCIRESMSQVMTVFVYDDIGCSDFRALRY